MSDFHAMGIRETLEALESCQDRGLSEKEAQRRLERYGPNRLEGTRAPGLLRRFWGQLRDPMILVLLAAAGLSLWASGGEDWLGAAIILLIVLVNACISISQEDSAQRALEALQNMSAPLAKVLRDGKIQRLETCVLVPGDIIQLEAGDLVPADGRILACAALKVDESAMTGESVPVDKAACGPLSRETPVAAPASLFGPVKLYVRPWQLQLAEPEAAHLSGTVRSSYRTQGRQRIEVADPEGRVLAVEDFDGVRYPAGHPVGLRINGGHVFG